MVIQIPVMEAYSGLERTNYLNNKELMAKLEKSLVLGISSLVLIFNK